MNCYIKVSFPVDSVKCAVTCEDSAFVLSKPSLVLGSLILLFLCSVHRAECILQIVHTKNPISSAGYSLKGFAGWELCISVVF